MAIIYGGFEEAAWKLIEMAPDSRLLDILNDHGQSPLHLAVLTNQVRITRRLILGGANPSVRDIEGNTPLHLACITGDLYSAYALTDPLSNFERSHLGPNCKIPALPQDLEQRNYKGTSSSFFAFLLFTAVTIYLSIPFFFPNFLYLSVSQKYKKFNVPEV